MTRYLLVVALAWLRAGVVWAAECLGRWPREWR